MKKSCFITGITGQDGAYLAELLLKKGYTVHGGARRISQAGTARLEKLGIRRDVHIHDFDLSEANNIFRTIQRTPVIWQPKALSAPPGSCRSIRPTSAAWGSCAFSTAFVR